MSAFLGDVRGKDALVCTDFVLISSQCVPCVLLELRCLVIEVTY